MSAIYWAGLLDCPLDDPLERQRCAAERSLVLDDECLDGRSRGEVPCSLTALQLRAGRAGTVAAGAPISGAVSADGTHREAEGGAFGANEEGAHGRARRVAFASASGGQRLTRVGSHSTMKTTSERSRQTIGHSARSKVDHRERRASLAPSAVPAQNRSASENDTDALRQVEVLVSSSLHAESGTAETRGQKAPKQSLMTEILGEILGAILGAISDSLGRATTASEAEARARKDLRSVVPFMQSLIVPVCAIALLILLLRAGGSA